jgi:type II secretory pathway pseudopilin PulG
MDKLKQWVVLTVVGCMAVLAAGWFLLISPKKAEAADLVAQTASQASHQRRLAHPARGAQGAGQGPAEEAGRAGPRPDQDPGQPGSADPHPGADHGGFGAASSWSA